MSPRKRIAEGDPILPQLELVSAGLHERDVYIASGLATAPIFEHDGNNPLRYTYTPEQICERVIAIADCMMSRKEVSK